MDGSWIPDDWLNLKGIPVLESCLEAGETNIEEYCPELDATWLLETRLDLGRRTVLEERLDAETATLEILLFVKLSFGEVATVGKTEGSRLEGVEITIGEVGRMEDSPELARDSTELKTGGMTPMEGLELETKGSDEERAEELETACRVDFWPSMVLWDCPGA